MQPDQVPPQSNGSVFYLYMDPKLSERPALNGGVASDAG